MERIDIYVCVECSYLYVCIERLTTWCSSGRFIEAGSGMADYPMLLVTGAKSGTVSLLKLEMKTGERPNYDGSSCTLLTHVYLHLSPPPPPPFFSFLF